MSSGYADNTFASASAEHPRRTPSTVWSMGEACPWWVMAWSVQLPTSIVGTFRKMISRRRLQVLSSCEQPASPGLYLHKGELSSGCKKTESWQGHQWTQFELLKYSSP
eukprot:2512651-Rhodomonas_salina.1